MLRVCDPSRTHGETPVHKLAGGPPVGSPHNRTTAVRQLKSPASVRVRLSSRRDSADVQLTADSPI